MKEQTLLIIYVLIPYILFSQNNYDPNLIKDNDKIIILTGGSRGIGHATSKNNLVIANGIEN